MIYEINIWRLQPPTADASTFAGIHSYTALKSSGCAQEFFNVGGGRYRLNINGINVVDLKATFCLSLSGSMLLQDVLIFSTLLMAISPRISLEKKFQVYGQRFKKASRGNIYSFN